MEIFKEFVVVNAACRLLIYWWPKLKMNFNFDKRPGGGNEIR